MGWGAAAARQAPRQALIAPKHTPLNRHPVPRAPPPARPFDPNSWARGSPGGAPYKADAGYTISPVNPYVSGGTPVTNTMVGLTSAMQGLGLTTAALRAAGIGRH